MTTCSVCFGGQKILVGDDLYWCKNCTPSSHAGLLTSAKESLPTFPAPKGIIFHTTEGIPSYYGTIHNEADSSGDVAEDPQPPVNVNECINNCSNPSIIFIKKVENYDFYSHNVEYVDGEWKIYVEWINSEPGNDLGDMYRECTSCGATMSIPESFTLEFC